MSTVHRKSSAPGCTILPRRDPDVIEIRSDAEWAQLGAGLSEDELKHLYGLIRRVMARGASA